MIFVVSHFEFILFIQLMRTRILCMDTHDLPEADVLGPFSHLKPLHTVCDIKVMYTSTYIQVYKDTVVYLDTNSTMELFNILQF